MRLRRGISNDDVFLAQLDVDFDRAYTHLKSAARGFVRAWYHDCAKPLWSTRTAAGCENFDYLLAARPHGT